MTTKVEARAAELSVYAKDLNLEPRFAVRGKQFYRALPKLQSSKGIVVDRAMKARMRDQGFIFDDSKDNRSVCTAEQLFDRLARFSEPRPWKPDKKALTGALRAAYSAFARRDDEPYLETVNTWSLLPWMHSSSNAGMPSMGRRGDTFVDDEQRAFNIEVGAKSPQPCVPFSRVGFGDDGPRPRLVFGYPNEMTIIEGQFAVPLINHFKEQCWTPMAFAIDKGEMRGYTHSLERFNTRVGLDFSGFDATLNKWFINRAFDILATFFHPRCKDIWRIIRSYFVHTPIAMPDAQVYVTPRGVPSGSWFTQLVDSICCFIAVVYAMIRATGRGPKLGELFVLGDDALLGTNFQLNKQEFLGYFEELGLSVNLEKTYWCRPGQKVHFLGYEWLHGWKTRDVSLLSRQAVYPERSDSLKNVHHITRVTAILLEVDNGLPLLMAIFGLYKFGDLYLQPLPGRLPVLGAARAEEGLYGHEPGVIGDLVYSSLR